METALGLFSRHTMATTQARRECFLNPRPSQRSGLSSTSGASERFVAGLAAGARSVLPLYPFLVTLMGLPVAEVSPLLETRSA